MVLQERTHSFLQQMFLHSVTGKQYGLVEVGLSAIAFQKPSLDGSQRHCSLDLALLGISRLDAPGYGRQLRNGRLLKQLRRRDSQPSTIGLGGNLDTDNRISAQLEKVVVNTD